MTGAKSEDDSRLASRKYARIIQKLGFDAKFAEFKIQNIVGSCDVKFPIRLEGLAFSHGAFSSYEPELFPGLIYRMLKPKVVLLIFVSGKIVLTGAKVREEIYMAFKQIYSVLVGECTAAELLERPLGCRQPMRFPSADHQNSARRLEGASFTSLIPSSASHARHGNDPRSGLITLSPWFPPLARVCPQQILALLSPLFRSLQLRRCPCQSHHDTKGKGIRSLLEPSWDCFSHITCPPRYGERYASQEL